MLYKLRNVVKTRSREKGYRLLIRNLTVNRGTRLALTGPSGCGKSTTLDILGLSLAPDSARTFEFMPGEKPVNIMGLWEKGYQDELSGFRLHYLGYVLQSGELLPFLSVGENIMLTSRLLGRPAEAGREAGARLAEKLGIEHLWNSLPDTLSVGERQRAAIARALAPGPDIILADEPTAALDPLHAARVMEVLLECLEDSGSALILVTHDAQWALSGGLRQIRFRLEEQENSVTAILDENSA